MLLFNKGDGPEVGSAETAPVRMIFSTFIQGGKLQWQYQREKLQRQEKTQDVQQYGSLKLLLLQNVLSAVNSSSLTGYAQTAALTTAEK